MTFYLIGIDYKTTPLAIRESAYARRRQIAAFCREIQPQTAALFTCNRIELYGVTRDIFTALKNIRLLQGAFGEVFAKAYLRCGISEVTRHALRLSCGLESQLAAEAEITQQLAAWIEDEGFPQVLQEFWNRVLTQADIIRLQSGLSENKTDIARVLLDEIIRKVNLNREKKVVIIGTGKLAQLFARNCPDTIKLYFVSGKRHSRALQLAASSKGEAVSSEKLALLLTQADAVITATASPHYVLRKSHFSDIAPKKERFLYIYDLSLPRVIQPEVGVLQGVFLQNLDDLKLLFAQHNRRIVSYIQQAEYLIEEKISVYSPQVRDAAQPAGLGAGR